MNPPDRNTDPAQQNFGADSERTRRESSTVQASRKTLWAVAIVCVVAASFWVSGRQDLPFVFLSGDERNYAEIGRRVATGRGFTTGVIYPIEVDWGVDEAHPSLLRPPLWPLVLAGAFTLGSADEVTAHLVVGLCFVITCLLTYAIGASLRGPLVGLIAGVTAAATPMFSKYAMLAGTEMLLALWIALATLLFVRKANPFWIGCVCGLAYLSRYNAGVLLIASLLFLPANRPRWKPYALCLAGFVLACAPWWLRNAVVTGNPFFSLYTSTLWAGPGLLPGKVLWMLDPPDVSIMHPLMRAYDSMAPALAAWPVPASNLVAFIGLVLGCVYLSRPHLFLGVALLMSKLAVTLVILNNRYLVPFVPSMIALGSAAWVLYGGRIGRLALISVLAMPFLPTIPLPGGIIEGTLAAVRDRTRTHGDTFKVLSQAPMQFVTCMDEETLIIAKDPTAAVWLIDNVAIQMPRSEEDFWELAESHSVRIVITPDPPGKENGRFDEVFAPRPDCGPHTFERRVH